MDFTFGILTDGKQDEMVAQIIKSIQAENIPHYEILVVGDSHVSGDFIRVICNADTEAKQNGRAWVTKKKNIIAQQAQYENIVFMHDYIELVSGWYDGWKKFNELTPTWEVAVNYVLTLEGGRHSDWVLSPYDMWYLFPELNGKWDLRLAPDEDALTRFMYISGGYWVSKKKFAIENLQLEKYGWGESEDVYWSEIVRRKTKFYFNPNSTVRLLKPGKWQPGEMPMQYVLFLKRMSEWMTKNGH